MSSSLNSEADICLVLELLGPDLRCWQVCFGNPGLSLTCVKRVITQVSLTCTCVHSKPEA